MHNAKLDLFKKNLKENGRYINIKGKIVKALIVDKKDNTISKDTKELFVMNDNYYQIGGIVVINNDKYFITNIDNEDIYYRCLVEKYVHTIKVKYPNNYPLLEYDVLVKDTIQSTVSSGVIIDARVGECTIYIARDEKGIMLQDGTRFFLFGQVYKIIGLTYECTDLLKCFCKKDNANVNDDKENGIADNSHITPPKRMFVVSATSGENGSISPAGEIKVQEGDNITFTFNSNNDYMIDSVLVDGKTVVITDNKYTLSNVTSNHAINVTFKEMPKIKYYTISPNVGRYGSITPSIATQVQEGDNITFEIAPNDGYSVDTVLVDELQVTLADGRYTFNNVVSDHVIKATFKEKVADRIVNKDNANDYEIFTDISNTYIILNPNDLPCKWSIECKDKDVAKMVHILSSDNKSCVVITDDYTGLMYQKFTIRAEYGDVVLTTEITIVT